MENKREKKSLHSVKNKFAPRPKISATDATNNAVTTKNTDSTNPMDTDTKKSTLLKLEIRASKREILDKTELQRIFATAGVKLVANKFNPSKRVCVARLKYDADLEKALAMDGELCSGTPITVKLKKEGKKEPNKLPAKQHYKLYFRYFASADSADKPAIKVIKELLTSVEVVDHKIKLFKETNSGWIRVKNKMDAEKILKLNGLKTGDSPIQVSREPPTFKPGKVMRGEQAGEVGKDPIMGRKLAVMRLNSDKVSIQDLLAVNGVEHVFIPRNKRSIAFLTFLTPHLASLVLDKEELIINGCVMPVELFAEDSHRAILFQVDPYLVTKDSLKTATGAIGVYIHEAKNVAYLTFELEQKVRELLAKPVLKLNGCEMVPAQYDFDTLKFAKDKCGICEQRGHKAATCPRADVLHKNKNKKRGGVNPWRGSRDGGKDGPSLNKMNPIKSRQGTGQVKKASFKGPASRR